MIPLTPSPLTGWKRLDRFSGSWISESTVSEANMDDPSAAKPDDWDEATVRGAVR